MIYFLQKFDMGVASRTFNEWLLKQLEIWSIYTRARKRQASPKNDQVNWLMTSFKLNNFELYLTTQRARKVDTAAIFDSNHAQNARKIASYVTIGT